MNPYAPPVYYRKSDPKVLWAALVFFVFTGIYSTFSQLTAAGQAITTKLPASNQMASPPKPSLAKPNPSKNIVATTATPVTPTASAEILPPFNTFPANAMEMGQKMNAAWFGQAHWPALKNLWTRESNWNPGAVNRSSGACGIPQALPCSKITDMTPRGQIQWGLSYIERRYKNPTNAWMHFKQRGWY